MIKLILETLRKNLTGGLVAILMVLLYDGCSTVPLTKLVETDGTADVLKALMERNNKIVHITPSADRNKPALLLLHGATEDPGEMIDIVRACRSTHDIFLYSFNFHMRAEKVAAVLADEVRRLKSENKISTNLAVVTFSYSAIIFRAAVVLTDDTTVFEGASLVQLVPTSGGSFLARGMGIASGLVALASKPSAASYPYSDFAKRLWEGEGNKKFYEIIIPERMHTLLLEGDPHSLSKIRNKEARQRYENGLGENVTLLQKSSGVTHDFFPNHPIVLAYLKSILASWNDSDAVSAKPLNDEAALHFEKLPLTDKRVP